MARQVISEQQSTLDSYQRLGLEELRPLGSLVAPEPPTRKRDLVPFLAEAMARVEVVRRLYEALDETGRAAVQEATHGPAGRVDRERFRAKYGRLPDFGTAKDPTPLRLFLPRDWQLPADLHAILRTFVPPPRAEGLAAHDDLPEAVPLKPPAWGRRREGDVEVPLRQRATAPVAEREVRAVLRLIEAGKVRVSDKTRRPIGETIDAVRGVLVGGDFYDPADESEDDGDPASDLAIRAFAWPSLVQAAGLAAAARNTLELTAAGRKALGQPPHAVLRALWRKWLGTTAFDEFHRVEAIKGQRRAGLTAVARRRQVVVEALRECPAGRWVAVDELMRFMRATGRDFEVSRSPWELYIAEPEYGSLGYDDEHAWEQLQGRFVLALLFEPAATLGLLDVAYVPPQEARDDFLSRWGADDLSCLSRYDGLEYVRVNALGAWCLGMAEEYRPEPVPSEPRFRVLPNLDVVASDLPPEPADVLLLDRVGVRTSESVWRLDRAKILAAVEGGLGLAELEEFLAAGGHGPLPQTVRVLLADLGERAGRLRDLGTARLIECADAETARLLAGDRQLGKVCHLAGERLLVFRAEDEAAVRARLRKLGYVVPPAV